MNLSQNMSASITYILFVVNSIAWFILGLLLLFELSPAFIGNGALNIVMGVLGIISSAAYLALLVLLRKKIKIAYYLSIILLILVSILSITDEFGLFDLGALAINVIPLLLLIKDRHSYLEK